MKIHIELDVAARDVEEQALEQLRTEIRQSTLRFIFNCAERVKIDHTQVSVTGDIVIEENV